MAKVNFYTSNQPDPESFISQPYNVEQLNLSMKTLVLASYKDTKFSEKNLTRLGQNLLREPCRGKTDI